MNTVTDDCFSALPPYLAECARAQVRAQRNALRRLEVERFAAWQRTAKARDYEAAYWLRRIASGDQLGKREAQHAAYRIRMALGVL